MDQFIYPNEHLLGDVLLPTTIHHGDYANDDQGNNEWNCSTTATTHSLYLADPSELQPQQQYTMFQEDEAGNNPSILCDHGNFAEFIVGKSYKRADIHQAIGGQHQSGISTPSKYNVILCFTINQPESTGYYDALNPGEGKWIFSGQGQNHMTFTKGNLQLREHKKNGKRVFLFSRDKKKKELIFEGEVEVEHVEVTGVANVLGVPRAAILFHLRRMHLDPVRVDLNNEVTTRRKHNSKAQNIPTPIPLLALTHSHNHNHNHTPQEDYEGGPPTPPIHEVQPSKKSKRGKNLKKTKPSKKAKTKPASVSEQPQLPQHHQAPPPCHTPQPQYPLPSQSTHPHPHPQPQPQPQPQTHNHNHTHNYNHNHNNHKKYTSYNLCHKCTYDHHNNTYDTHYNTIYHLHHNHNKNHHHHK
eukprot:Phypoly_transcript_08421.p1 GENE.Phypoly_transcript_08421~~Phypoly_transcript_08421.p1  ORF type:complete len:413 (+),score=55.14 Phypoly_transcript_08421:63-1301(+)